MILGFFILHHKAAGKTLVRVPKPCGSHLRGTHNSVCYCTAHHDSLFALASRRLVLGFLLLIVFFKVRMVWFIVSCLDGPVNLGLYKSFLEVRAKTTMKGCDMTQRSRISPVDRRRGSPPGTVGRGL